MSSAPRHFEAPVVQRPPARGLLGAFFSGLRALLEGMGVTWHYLVRPSTVVTQQYPENRDTLRLPERTRAMLSFQFDANGFHKCTACHICEQTCPNASIHVVERKPPKLAKVELDSFIWRLDSCTFCNLCVLVCPFSVLKMKPSFESAVFDQRLLTVNLAGYSGATEGPLLKVADPGERAKLIEPRPPYSGPLPLEGSPLAGIPGHPAPAPKEGA